MATVTDPGIDFVDTNNVTSYACTAFTPASGDLLVFAVATSTSVEPTAAGAMTDNQGGTYTLADFALRTASASSIYIFVRDQAATAVSTTATFTCTGDSAQGCCIVPLRVAGMARYGASAIKQVVGADNGGAGGTPAATFGASVLTGNVTVGAVGSSTNPVTVTPPASWTEASDIGVATPTQGIEVVYRNSGFTGTTVTWGSTTVGTWGAVLVELDTSVLNTNLVVQNASHAHTAANLDITQVHELGVINASHAHSAQAVVLQEVRPASGDPSFKVGTSSVGGTHLIGGSDVPAVPTLVISDGMHGHTSANVALTQVHELAVASASHAHTAENLVLTQVHVLAVSDGLHAHTAQNVALVVDLAIANASHAHTATTIALTQDHQLVVANASHTQTAANVALTQVHELAVANASHAQVAENVALTQVHNLVVDAGLHGHTAENVALSIAESLGIQDASHAHTAEDLVLTQVHQLGVQSATHAQTADNVALEVTLAIANATHSHTAQNLDLTQVHVLVVQNATHAHTADNIVLAPAGDLIIQSAIHAHTAANVALTQEHALVVQSGAHAHTAQNLVLTAVHVLVVQDALHGHTAQQLTLTQVHALLIANGLHAHAAETVVLALGVLGVPVAGGDAAFESGVTSSELVGAGNTTDWGSGGSTA